MTHQKNLQTKPSFPIFSESISVPKTLNTSQQVWLHHTFIQNLGQARFQDNESARNFTHHTLPFLLESDFSQERSAVTKFAKSPHSHQAHPLTIEPEGCLPANDISIHYITSDTTPYLLSDRHVGFK